MKKKSLLVFLLAAVSTVTLGAAACKKTEEHEHKWSYKSNNDLHWQACSGCDATKDYGVHNDADGNGKCDVCGADATNLNVNWSSDEHNHWVANGEEKLGIGGHVDLVNNETGANGKDGHCDTCDKLLKETVTFDAMGICDIAPVSVDHGTKLTTPAAPEVQGWIFDGWYSDAARKTAFDFTSPITDATTIYAKFTEDTTPGSNANHAIAVENLGAPVSHSFGKFTKLYFKYTATAVNRYKTFMGAGAANEACSFVTDLNDDSTTCVGENDIFFDLKKGDSVVIEVTRGSGVTDTQNIEVYVEVSDNEPVPADGWNVGVWENLDADVSLSINKNGSVTYKDEEYNTKFVGGANAKLTFSVGSITYTVTSATDDALYITGGNTNCILSRYVKPDPIAVSEFSGIYENKDGGTVSNFGGLKSICVYNSGNGYIVRNSTTDNCVIGENGTSYNQERNILTYYYSYNMSLNFNSESVAVSVTVRYNGKTAVYTRTGDAGDEIPASLPITEDVLYYGENGSTLKKDFFGCKFNGSGYNLSIDDYVASENKYTVSDNKGTHILIIEGSGDSAVIKVLDGDNNVTDTLTMFNPVLHDLARENNNVTLTAADFNAKLYFFKATSAGYYKFTSSETSLTAYAAETAQFTLDPEFRSGVDFTADGNAVYLEEGDVVAISIAGYETAPASVAFTVAPGLPPRGTAANNPVTVEVSASGLANVDLSDVPDSNSDDDYNKYFIEFTGVKAGTYYMCVSYITSWGDESYNLVYTVNGEKYGCEMVNWKYVYYGGLSAENHFAEITVAEGTDKLVVIANQKPIARLWVDAATGAQDLTFDGEGAGTVNANGNYKCESFGDLKRVESVTFTCESDFTVYIDGLPAAGKSLTLTAEQLAKGFTLEVADGASVAYKANFERGAQQNPYKFDTLSNAHNIYFKAGTQTYVELDLSAYTANTDFVIGFATAKQFYFQINGEGTKYGYGGSATQIDPFENVVYEHTVTDEASKKLLLVVSSDGQFTTNVSLSALVNIRKNANPLTYSTITMGEAQIMFASLNAAAGNSDIKIEVKDSTTMIFTGVSPFSIMLENGSVLVAQDNGGNYVIDNLSVTSQNVNYIRFMSEDAQSVMVATSYAHGSATYPYTAMFENAVAEFTLARGATAYYTVDAGTYVFTGNATASVGVANYEKNKEFTLSETTLVRFTNNSYYSTSVSLKMVAPENMQRNYAYTDSDDIEHVVEVTATEAVLDGTTTYTLVGREGYVYTYEAGTGDDVVTMTLTLDPEGLKCGEYDMELAVSQIFTLEQAGTYKGNVVGMDISITFDVTGKGSMDMPDSSFWEIVHTDFKKITVNGDGTYTVGACTFTFTETGLKITSLHGMSAAYNLDHIYIFTAEQAGKYAGKMLGSYNVSVEFTRGGVGVLVLIDASQKTVTSEFSSITVNGDGTYTIAATNGNAVFKFNDDGSITFTTVPTLNFTADMTKQHLFTEAQAGEYTSDKFGGVSITFDVDGKGTMTMPLGTSDFTVTTETITEIVDNGNETYTINGKVTFKFTSAGITVTNLPMGPASCDLAKPAPVSDLVAGTYTGTNSFDATITLVIKNDLVNCSLAENGESYDYTITDNGNSKYTISDGTYSYDFTLNADKTITIEYNSENVVLTKQA